MGLKLNLEGQTFGRLKVLSEAGRTKSGNVLWLCRCDCGRESTVASNELRRGDSKSCSCLRAERAAETRTIHGHANEKSPTYRSWKSMIQRCTNSKRPSYPHYGGSGVTVSPRWLSFENFLADMGVRPANTTLGRILDMGDYTKSNCEWQTWKQQRAEAKKKRLLKWKDTNERFDSPIHQDNFEAGQPHSLAA